MSAGLNLNFHRTVAYKQAALNAIAYLKKVSLSACPLSLTVTNNVEISWDIVRINLDGEVLRLIRPVYLQLVNKHVRNTAL